MLQIINKKSYLDDNRKPIKKLIRKFLDASRKGQKYFKRSIISIENAIENRNGLLFWVEDRGLGPEGYAVTIVMLDELQKTNLIILQYYGLNSRSWLHHIEEHSKKCGVNKILFQTSRNRSAVKRWLKDGWKLGPTIFEKRL